MQGKWEGNADGSGTRKTVGDGVQSGSSIGSWETGCRTSDFFSKISGLNHMNYGKLLTALLFTMAGAGCCLMLLNRFVIHIPDGEFKNRLMQACLIVLILLPAPVFLIFGTRRWVVAPIALIALLGIGELRRAWIRFAYAASPAETSMTDRILIDRPVDTFNAAVARYDVVRKDLPLERLRIALLSDLHVQRPDSVAYYSAVIQKTLDEKPDLIFLTGDFISHASGVPWAREALAKFKGRPDVYAVLGNHDYWTAPEEVADMLSELGVVRVAGTCLDVRVRSAELRICGDEAPWGPAMKPTPHEPGADARFTLVLTHTPDNIYRLAEDHADAVFAGHYHGGQIRLPYLGSLVIPSIYGRRFDYGHFTVNGAELFVTSGLGTSGPAFRVYCPPEIVVVEFRAGR